MDSLRKGEFFGQTSQTLNFDGLTKLKVNQSLGFLHRNYGFLTDVALECGFSDQSHFIRCFRENMGVPPLKYRNLLNK
ncbi:helix-turn-helix domain-containing protein [Chryseobacterium sp. PTM-20240506]|uniref:AraC family transcriptional regulator n=1 Tax=Chryseobacterium sp. PTM-20240506 TaxID=3400631 RepID=UPI003AAFD5AF